MSQARPLQDNAIHRSNQKSVKRTGLIVIATRRAIGALVLLLLNWRLVLQRIDQDLEIDDVQRLPLHANRDADWDAFELDARAGLQLACNRSRAA